MFRTTTTTATLILTLALPLSACLDSEAFGPEDEFRAVIVKDGWGIHGPTSFPDVNSCADYWNDRCASLTPSQCTVAKNRYTCTDSMQGPVVTDTYGETVEALQWDAYSRGDEDVTGGEGSAADSCELMSGIEYEPCLALAAMADAVAEASPELLAHYPAGGLASLIVIEDNLMLTPLGEGDPEDLLWSTADALDWVVPMIEGEFEIPLSQGYVFEDDVILALRPNGSVSVSTSQAIFMHDAAVIENTMCGGDWDGGILTTDEG